MVCISTGSGALLSSQIRMLKGCQSIWKCLSLRRVFDGVYFY